MGGILCGVLCSKKYYFGIAAIPCRYNHGMELRHLRYFVAVAEEQNFTRAAARLNVSQPPLSRQIRDLEDELGTKLFERKVKSVRLTGTGKIFFVEAREVLKRVDEAVDLIKDVAHGKRGRVKVGFAASPSAEILPKALRLFHKSNPKVSVDIHSMSTQGMLSGLREGTLDAALVVSISPQDFVGLTMHELVRYSVRIAVNRKHRFARMKEVSLRDVASEPLLTFTRKDYPEAHAGLAKILEAYTPTPKIVGEYESALSLLAAVEAGRGVALDFETLAFLAGERVVFRPLRPAPPSLPLSIAYRANGISTATVDFVAAVRAVKSKQSSHPALRA
jgi:LysR family transcriptional regulator, benzoate and cis,cis-muconate-responsive activator of ben and cat genes